jgi:hypothetical protein
MSRPFQAVVLACAALTCVTASAHAHGVAGNRIFPATLAIDDPAVGDELSLPTFTYQPSGAGTQYGYGFEWDKTITSNLGISFNDGYSVIDQHPGDGGNLYGWGNPVVTLKYRFFENDAHELLASAGVQREFGGGGAVAHGIADATGWTQPTLYAGKGFGDLPKSWGALRAFAITGELGYQLADTANAPDAWNIGASIQFPLQYLQTQVKDYGLPAMAQNLIPIVEFAYSTPASAGRSNANTTGTIAPGFLYEADTYQIGVEALIPATRASGSRTGFIAQLHFYLDDIFPHSIGKPIFGRGA